MPLDRLPRELIDKIIQHLPKSDVLSVSLTSSHLSPSTRPILFSTIIITSRESDNVFDQFIGFINSSPDISKLILDITFREGQQALGQTPLPLPLTLNQLDSLLSTLPRLQGLHLDNIRLHDFAPGHVAQQARYRLERFTISDGVHKSVVIAALKLFSSIHELRVTKSDHSTPTELPEWEDTRKSMDTLLNKISAQIPQGLTVSSLRLEVNLACAEFYTELLRRTRTPSALTSCTLDWTGLTLELRSSSVVFELLRESSGTLTHLAFGDNGVRKNFRDLGAIRGDYTSEEMVSKLSKLTALSSVTIYVSYRPSSTLITTHALSRFGALLSSFPSTLRRIQLSFRPMPDEDLGPWYSPEIDGYLQELVPAFRRYPMLEAIVFQSAYNTSSEEKGLILQNYPEFATRDLIRF
ncbi:hypothetical protein NM688_g9066 [Phlebia brevispora]|uniref:Uncharacterized protein n=1 Tax=Phlebia brevispora TaxID=194682 RepID=A0ACC1RNB5_9APHY|nr:hypothetical protein NM688_g9066 [Phlebia brevispora]